MRTCVVIALAALLAAQTGCAGYSQNHRVGLMLLGGAAVVTGLIMTMDGAFCDNTSVAGGVSQCVEDNAHRNVVFGVSTLVGGLVLGGTAYVVKPRAK